MNKASPFPSKRTRIDVAILSVYSQPIFEQEARRTAFGPKAWLFQNVWGVGVAIILLVGGVGMIAVAANQSLLDAYGTRAMGIIKNVSFRTDTYGHRTKWEKIVYEFTAQQGVTIQATLDRPVQELAGLPVRDNLVVVYWERFPGINAPRGVKRGGAVVMGIGLFLLLCSFHFIGFVRRGIRWRRSLLAGSAAAGPDQRGQLPHVVKNSGRTRDA